MISSAKSAEAPSFALRATEGPPSAFIHGLTAVVFCVGGIKTSKLRTRLEKIKIDHRVQDYQKLLKLGIKEVVYQRSREKGIEVKLAADLIVGAVDKKYDTAIVISSDTDLVPAVDWVRKRMRLKIEYVGFNIRKREA